MDRLLTAARRAAAVLLAAAMGGACAGSGRSYPFSGQILAVHADRREITIKHEDISGLMPAMTMTFPVVSPDLLTDRKPGDLVTGVLDVREGLGRIRRLTSIGWTPLPDRTNAADMAGNVLAPGDAIPDAALVDQADRRRSLSDWRGYWVLVTFVYTRCPLPTFCPLMDQNFSTLQRAIAEQATLRARVRLVSISFDPAHDTPAVLSAHARRLKADPALWTFLTGDEVTVDRVAARFGVGVLRAAEPGGEITHNLRTSLVDPEGRLAHVFTGNEWTPGAVLASVRRFVTP